jgi:hypothetical protein
MCLPSHTSLTIKFQADLKPLWSEPFGSNPFGSESSSCNTKTLDNDAKDNDAKDNDAKDNQDPLTLLKAKAVEGFEGLLTNPSISYKDPEGDLVAIKTTNDLLKAYRFALQSQRPGHARLDLILS